MRDHLTRLSRLLRPHAAVLDRRFQARLRTLHFNSKQQKTLSQITAGALARVFAASNSAAAFFEQVEYSGRRLAKLGVPPGQVVEALREYDVLLDPLIRELSPSEFVNFHWTREQLHFAVVLTLNNAFYQVRETETQAFFDLFHAELEARDLGDLLERFLSTLTRASGAEAGRIALLDRDRKTWFVSAKTGGSGAKRETFKPAPPAPALLKSLSRPRLLSREGVSAALILDPALRGRYKSCWSVPLTADQRIAGVMQFGFATEYEWLPRELELLNAAAERIILSAQRARLMEELVAREQQVRKLSEHLVQVEEEERRRISRELHDEAGQSLLTIRLQLDMMEQTLPAHSADLRAKLAQTREVAERVIIEIRRIIASLSPAVLEQLGLPAALRQLTSRFRNLVPARVKLQISPRLGRLPKDAETITYRLLQECFNNIAKHSRASNVIVRLHSTDQSIELCVEDDGVGFDICAAFQKRGSFGLLGMKERVALLGGRFEVDSAPNRGTRISVELPIKE